MRDPEKLRQYTDKWRAENRDAHLAARRRWRKKNRAKINAAKRERWLEVRDAVNPARRIPPEQHLPRSNGRIAGTYGAKTARDLRDVGLCADDFLP